MFESFARARVAAAIVALFTTSVAAAGPLDTLQPGQWYDAPNTHMSAVFPANPPPGAWGPGAVIGAWGGGVYDTKRDRLTLWGGGHTDYSGNEVYVFDVNSMQWSRITDPSSNVSGTDSSGVYPDGLPRSAHTYNTVTYADNVDRMFLMAPAGVYSSGQEVLNAFAFDLTSNQWSSLTPVPNVGATTGGIPTYDSTTGLIWYHGSGASWATSRLVSYNTSSMCLAMLMSG